MKTCEGTELGACQHNGKVKEDHRCKRCPSCAKEQHRIVARRSFKKHWPEYRKRRQHPKRELLYQLAAAAGLETKTA